MEIKHIILLIYLITILVSAALYITVLTKIDIVMEKESGMSKYFYKYTNRRAQKMSKTLLSVFGTTILLSIPIANIVMFVTLVKTVDYYSMRKEMLKEIKQYCTENNIDFEKSCNAKNKSEITFVKITKNR